VGILSGFPPFCRSFHPSPTFKHFFKKNMLESVPPCGHLPAASSWWLFSTPSVPFFLLSPRAPLSAVEGFLLLTLLIFPPISLCPPSEETLFSCCSNLSSQSGVSPADGSCFCRPFFLHRGIFHRREPAFGRFLILPFVEPLLSPTFRFPPTSSTDPSAKHSAFFFLYCSIRSPGLLNVSIFHLRSVFL